MIGKTLAHYEITALLGKGGMGEVYRARDTKLDRDVALKVLPTELSGDPERAARFEREARMLASLQHTNIASIYGYERVDGVRFLTMELAEGEDLAQRLERGQVSIEESLQIARQIAIGLEAAHEKNIIHRDLKPANIKVDSNGVVKILDFGLARAYAGDPQEPENLDTSPTITAAMTQMGVILGTAAYMSPEQAKGKSVDKRSDIWSYGVVLFEMLCGRKLFEGETISETMAEVMKSEIDWSLLPSDTPRWLMDLLRRCLDRDPSNRLQSIGEARISLQRDRHEEIEAVVSRPTTSKARSWPWIAVAAALLLLAAAVAWNGLRENPVQALVQSTLMPPTDWDFESGSPFAVSPDGRQIAYVASARVLSDTGRSAGRYIWLRNLSEPEARRLEGTNGASYPFWSPDGHSIAFFTDTKLNKIDTRGGPVIGLTDTRSGRGGSWGPDGTIVFQRGWSEGLMKIPAGGGTPEPITTLNAERFDLAHRWPHFLPDGRRFLFYLVSTTSTTASEHSGIYVGSLDSDEVRFLLRSESRATYAQGHLLYRVGSTLMARAFDAGSLEFTGDPAPVATDVPGGAISWGGAHFDASESGLLVHLRGAGATNSLLTWRDRDGKQLGFVGEEDGYWEPAVSHDGRHVAVAVGQDAADIWLHDLERDTRTRFTFDAADERTPLWSPDDSKIAFASARTSVGEIYERPTSGQGDAKLLYTSGINISLNDWSRDGRWILFTGLAPSAQGWDIWALDMETLQAKPILNGPFNEATGCTSPDGKWLAFTSDESGRSEIYVQSFPDADGRWMLSTDGGIQPVWGGDGTELYFVGADEVIMSVDVSTATSFSFGTPKPLFATNTKASTGARFVVSQDGQRFLTNDRPPVDPGKIGARLIQNWTALLREY